MSQKLAADYLEGYGFPVPQNDFILVEIKDKEEDTTKSGLIKSATADIKPYILVVALSDNVKKSEMDIQVNDIMELVDVRHLTMFAYENDRNFALIDKKNIGALYRRKADYVAKPAKKKLNLVLPPEAGQSRPSIQIVGKDELE